jgi:two-component system chemotaxis sensor kinase CheA
VLVAEDSDFFRNLIVPAIGAAGYDVTTVNNGRDALRLRDAGERFDVIISDIHMPEMDGVALARAVREGGAWATARLSGAACQR